MIPQTDKQTDTLSADPVARMYSLNGLNDKQLTYRKIIIKSTFIKLCVHTQLKYTFVYAVSGALIVFE